MDIDTPPPEQFNAYPESKLNCPASPGEREGMSWPESKFNYPTSLRDRDILDSLSAHSVSKENVSTMSEGTGETVADLINHEVEELAEIRAVHLLENHIAK